MKRSHLFLAVILLSLILVNLPVLAQDSSTQEVRSESSEFAITQLIPSAWSAETITVIGDYPALAVAPEAAMIDMQALEGSDPPVFSGSDVMFITTLTDNDNFGDFDTSGGVETMIASWVEGVGSFLGEPSPVVLAEVGGRPAARVEIAAETLSLTLMLVEAGEDRRGEAQYVLHFIFAAPGSSSEYTDRLLTIAGSVQVYENGLPRLVSAGDADSETAFVPSGDSFVALLAALPVPSDLAFDDDGLLNTVQYLHLSSVYDGTTASLFAYGSVIEDIAIADQRDMQATIGFGLDAIDHIMVYGTPPLRMTLLEGEFDSAAVEEALTGVIGLTRTDQSDYAEYCHADGCDQGFRSDPRSQQRGNPFGGNIGRREVFALLMNPAGPDRLIVSPSVDLVHAAVDRLMNGAAPSVPFADALLADARPILAAALFDGALVGDGVESLTFSAAPDTPIVTLVQLTLGDADSAATNAAGLSDRLMRESADINRTFAEYFDLIKITVSEASINGNIVIFTLTGTGDNRSAPPSFSGGNGNGRPPFLMVNDMMNRGDLGWLLD